MPSSTFSLFPSATDSSLEHKSLDLPALASRRRSMFNSKKAQAQADLPVAAGAKDALDAAGSAARSRTPSDTRRYSAISKTSASTHTKSNSQSSHTNTAASISSEQPISPDSYPMPSVHSLSPTLIGSNGSNRTSVSTLKPRKKAAPAGIVVNGPAQINSIFPTYDPDRQLQDQYYLPTQVSPTNIPWEQVCKMPYSPDFFPPEHSPEKTGLIFTAPRHNNSNNYTPEIELPALWELSNGRANAEAKSQVYRLQMHRNQASSSAIKVPKYKRKKAANVEPLLTFGPSSSTPFLTVLSETCKDEVEGGREETTQRVRIRKHNLSRFDPRHDHYRDSSALISDMSLDLNGPDDSPLKSPPLKSPPVSPKPTIDKLEEEITISVVTPHKAILDSLSMAGTSSTAAELASVDPGASSIAAAHLAEHAMNAAKEAHTCDIIFTTTPGTRQRGYGLRHPSLGLFRIEVTGDIRLHDIQPEPADAPSTGKAQPAKVRKPGIIKILAPVSEKHLYDHSVNERTRHHHHHSRSLKQAHNDPVLSSIDLETNTLYLHGPELTDINNKYILDTVVSAMVSVIVAETAIPRVSHLTTFEPPPTKALALVAMGRYKYLPLLGRRKQKKAGLREKTAAEMEESLSVAMGALVFVLGAAVDGIFSWAERAKDGNALGAQQQQQQQQQLQQQRM